MPLRPASSIALALVVTACALRAQEPAGNALGLMDAWLSTQAVHTAEYRADLRPCTESAVAPPGRLVGRSPFLGAFTYRPKAYRELSARERAEVLRDPGFRSYLASIRKLSDRPDSHAGFPKVRERAGEMHAVDLTFDEMLRPGPFRIIVSQ